jgi:hypothetical protein
MMLCIFAVSCKTSKETVTVALSTMTKEERLSSILRSGIPYHHLSSNLKLSIRTGKKNQTTSVDAQLRMIKDEAIQLSLRIPLLGSEAFRIVITPDKILMIDRINKQYLWENLQDIQSQLPFDFDYYSLEALLTNQLFIAGKKDISPSDYPAFQIQEDKFQVRLSCTDQQNITYDFTSDYSNRIQAIRMERSQSRSHLQGTYTDWGLTSGKRTFPMTMDWQLNTPEETHTINFTHKFVDIDTDFSIDTTIPNKYRQVTLLQVISLIKSLL